MKNNTLTNDRFPTAKKLVRTEIAMQAKRMGSPIFATLTEHDVEHEKEVLALAPKTNVFSLNRDKGIVDAMEVLPGNHTTVHMDICQWTRATNAPNISPRLIWFDFCALKSCWDSFFECVKHDLWKKDIIYVTFAAMPRSWERGEMPIWRKERGIQYIAGDTRANSNALYVTLRRKMAAFGWSSFYAVGYTNTGGAMITVGFKKSYKEKVIGKFNLDFLENPQKPQQKKINLVKPKIQKGKEIKIVGGLYEQNKDAIVEMLHMLNKAGLSPSDFWKATDTAGKRAAITRAINLK